MDNSVFFYTYSTIAQTLAAAFGFSISIVVYQIQGIARNIREHAELIMKDYSGATPEPLYVALINQDWNYFLTFIKESKTGNKNYYEEYCQGQIQYGIRKLSHIQKHFRRSLYITGFTVILSIAALSVTGSLLTYDSQTSWYILYLIVALSFVSLLSYLVLILVIFNIFKLT